MDDAAKDDTVADGDQDSPWYVQLFVSLGLLLGGAVLLCVALAAFALGTAFVLGFHSGSSGSTNTAIPAVTRQPHAASHSTSPGGPSARSKSGASHGLITLTVTPQRVSTYGRIDLRGTYAAPNGTRLQVQRQQPGHPWQNFPTQTTVSGGRFSTYIRTGHTGLNRLRVSDVQRSAVSNVVTVHVG